MSNTVLLNSIRKKGKPVNLDFSNELHNEYFLSLYGGYEVMRNQFPLLFQAYCKTKKCHERKEELSFTTLLQQDEQSRKNFVDGIDIGYTIYNKDNHKLSVEGVTSLVNKALFIDEHLDIKTKSGEMVEGRSQSTEDAYTSIILIDTDFNPAQFKSNSLEIDYTVTWIEEDTDTLKSQLFSSDVSEEVILTDCVDKVDLTFPISKVKNNPIVICYNRDPKLEEVVDRCYSEAIVGGVQKLLLDFSGDVTFKNNTAKFKQIIPTTFVLKLISRGMAQYSTAGRIDKIAKRFAKNTNGFSFTLDNDWKDNVPTARLPIKDNVQIEMKVQFILEDNKTGEIIISSNASESKGNVCKAIPLLLLWGCLSEDSLILMFDGTKKPIQSVTIGDRVITDDGLGIVSNTWKGVESDPLICIETDTGNCIKCTASHPIMTLEGIKTAESITGADILIGLDNQQMSIMGIYPTYEKNVYNIDITKEGEDTNGMMMVCNGIFVGDNKMQNAMSSTNETKQLNIYAKESKLKNQMFKDLGRQK